MDNANTKEYLDKIRAQVVENLKRTAFAPSVQMTDVPRDPLLGGIDDEADAILDDLDEDENKDKRFTKRRFDQYIEKAGELSDSEDEAENGTNGIRRQPGVPKRRNRQSYRNLDVADSGPDSGLATPRDVSSMPEDEMDLTADTKMGEAAEAGAEEQPSPIPAEPASRAEETPAAELNGTTGEGEAPAASVPTTRPASPVAQDEDTTMEDAGAPAPESEQTEAPINGPQEKTPPESPAAAAPEASEQPTSPAKSGSPAPSAPQPAEAAEATGSAAEAPKEEEAPVKAEEPAQPEESSEKPEESTKTEE